MALVRSKRRGRTGPSKKCQKVALLRQKIALFFHSSTIMEASHLHLNFKTKAGIMYSIESDDLFSKSSLYFCYENEDFGH